MFWTQDSGWCPDPITPLMGSLFLEIIEPAFNVGWETYELPFRSHCRRINTYLYYAQDGEPPASPEAAAQQHARAQAKLTAAMDRLGEIWAREWLPEITEYLEEPVAPAVHEATLPELLAQLDATLSRCRRVWDIHFRLVWPGFLAMSLFDELCRDLFGAGDTGAAFKLLQGLDNKVLDADRALWQLAQEAGASASVRATLTGRPVAEVIPALRELPAGQEFLSALARLLRTHGQRSNALGEIAEPPWLEDPSPVIGMVQDLLARPRPDPAATRATLAEERERLLAEARARLQGYPLPVRSEFERLLAAAQTATILAEDHNYWIDQRSLYPVRRVVLELGRRMAVAAAIEQADDVFYLTLAELRETAALLPRVERRRLVAARRAEIAYYRTITPAPTLGVPASGSALDTPFHRAMDKFFGAPPADDPDPTILRGAAGSPGTARGPARVLRSLAEAGTLQPGEILVVGCTTPQWTPLFTTAAAVVTDVGGVLSHCAILAREYRIPAVVGTGKATAAIRDGQLVAVDGHTGCVRIGPTAGQ